MTIRPRGPRVWQLVWECGVDPATGKRQRRYETVEGSKAAAEKRWRAIQKEIDDHLAVHTSPCTFAQWADQWMTTIRGPELDPTTQTHYQQLLRSHILPVLGAYRLQDLEPVHLQQAIRTWQQTPHPTQSHRMIGPRTVQQCWQLTARLVEMAYRWEVIPRNVADRIDPPTSPKPVHHWWTADQAQQFLSAALDTPWYGFWLVTLATGLRLGEVSGLSWQAVDWDQSALQIRQTWKHAGGWGAPKKDKVRWVIVDDATVRWLRQEWHRQQTGMAPNPYQLIFATKSGQPHNHRNVTRALNRAIARAHVPVITFHELRHTHGSLLRTAGVDPRVIADRLGHEDVRFTMDTYVHATVEDQQSGAQAVGRLLRAANPAANPLVKSPNPH